MYNRELEALNQYPYHIVKMSRTRGGVLVNCEEGDYLLTEYGGTDKRIKLLYSIGTAMEEEGFCIDRLVMNQEEELISLDNYGTSYCLRKWFQARECDAKTPADVIRATAQLGQLMLALEKVSKGKEEDCKVTGYDFISDVTRRNKELKNISNYIRQRRQKNLFEEQFQKMFDYYYGQGLQVAQMLNDLKTIDDRIEGVRYGICHKDYTHHNLLFMQEKMAIVHFDNMRYDCLVGDFALFLRKIMEKNNWSIALGNEMIHTFADTVKMTRQEYRLLYLQLLYPVRFLKVVNHYYNTKKSWVSQRDYEKLVRLEGQRKVREQFLVFMESLGI